MNAKIFSFVKVQDSSMIASVRIARFVGDTLSLPICWDESIQDEPLDVLVIVNGAYAFSGSSLLEALGRAIREAKRVVWIQNDYTIIPPKDLSGAESPFRKAFRDRYEAKSARVDYWTTCEVMSVPGVSQSGHFIGADSFYINWNCLTTEIRPVKPFADRVLDGMLLYYGSYRKERVPYFHRYFTNPSVDILLSSPTKKFEENFSRPRITHETKLAELYAFLGECGLGLYLEDKKSHTEFHSPANRFYEMLSAGLPIVFQPEAIRMMKKAGYDIEDWMVWDAAGVATKMEMRAQIVAQQREKWMYLVMREREDLGLRVKLAYDRVAQ
jgi:hypothetical protein